MESGRILLAGYWESAKLDCYAPDLLSLSDTRWGWWRGIA